MMHISNSRSKLSRPVTKWIVAGLLISLIGCCIIFIRHVQRNVVGNYRVPHLNSWVRTSEETDGFSFVRYTNRFDDVRISIMFMASEAPSNLSAISPKDLQQMAESKGFLKWQNERGNPATLTDSKRILFHDISAHLVEQVYKEGSRYYKVRKLFFPDGKMIYMLSMNMSSSSNFSSESNKIAEKAWETFFSGLKKHKSSVMKN